MNALKKFFSPLRDPMVGTSILLASFLITGVLTCYQLNREKAAAQPAPGGVGMAKNEVGKPADGEAVASENAGTAAKQTDAQKPTVVASKPTTLAKATAN